MVQLPTPTPNLGATVHSVTDRRTDDSMMPLGNSRFIIHKVRSATKRVSEIFFTATGWKTDNIDYLR